MHPIFALSVRNVIVDIGAYAGFAAVVAVALVALLLFAHARELKRLREWGAEAHDRIIELERSVAAALELARRAQAQAQRVAAPPETVAAPGRAPAGAPAAAAAGRAPAAGRAAAGVPAAPTRDGARLLPAAPANVGAPALASATVLVPLPDVPPRAADGAPSRPAAPTASPAARPPVRPGEVIQTLPVPGAGAAAPAELAPTTAHAVANGRTDGPPTPPPPPRRATPAHARAGTAARPPARPRPGEPPRRAAALRQHGAPTRAASPTPRRRRGRFVPMLVIVLALGAVGVGGYLVLGGGDDGARPVRVERPGGTGARRGRRARPVARVSPADTTVAVLNGTGVTGLASSTMQELAADGFQQGTVTDASDTGRPATVVEYRNGQEAAARAVARALSLTPDVVMPIRADSEMVACEDTVPCTIDVVVTIGADRIPD